MQVTNVQKISRKALQEVADFLPYPFLIAEDFGNTHLNTYVNEKFLEEIGYTLNEIPTIEAWYGCAYPNDDYRKSVIESWNLEQKNKQQKDRAFVKRKSLVTCKNGMQRWYEIKASVISKIHVIAFIDLDKEIALQDELLRINSNNDRILSILGHDLRSPIGNLMAISAMAVNEEISNADFHSLVHQINIQSNQVLDLLDRTLTWAKLNFDTITHKNAAVDLAAVIHSILEIYKTSFEVKKITFEIDIKNTTVQSDVEILTIIIRNIISNAIKFTPQNGTITIISDANGLIISDNGIGMTPEMIAHILNNTAVSRRGTENEIGIGMGMRLVIQLAKKINCLLFIESVPGEGTLVRLVP